MSKAVEKPVAQLDSNKLDNIAKQSAEADKSNLFTVESFPELTTFQYYGPPSAIGKAIQDYGLALKDYGMDKIEKKVYYSCLDWKKKIGWPDNSNDCCYKCHTKIGGHIGEHIWRHITGVTFKVCCGVKKLCTQTLESQWWCTQCKTYVTPVGMPFKNTIGCVSCSTEVVQSKKIKAVVNFENTYCPSCKDDKKVVYQSGTGYCNTCYWPVVSQNKQKTAQE